MIVREACREIRRDHEVVIVDHSVSQGSIKVLGEGYRAEREKVVDESQPRDTGLQSQSPRSQTIRVCR
jgi:hypothetical protein